MLARTFNLFSLCFLALLWSTNCGKTTQTAACSGHDGCAVVTGPDQPLGANLSIYNKLSATLTITDLQGGQAPVSKTLAVTDKAVSVVVPVSPGDYNCQLAFADTLGNGNTLNLAAYTTHCTILNDPNGTGISFASTPASYDFDADTDGVSNLQELQQGSSPEQSPLLWKIRVDDAGLTILNDGALRDGNSLIAGDGNVLSTQAAQTPENLYLNAKGWLVWNGSYIDLGSADPNFSGTLTQADDAGNTLWSVATPNNYGLLIIDNAQRIWTTDSNTLQQYDTNGNVVGSPVVLQTPTALQTTSSGGIYDGVIRYVLAALNGNTLYYTGGATQNNNDPIAFYSSGTVLVAVDLGQSPPAELWHKDLGGVVTGLSATSAGVVAVTQDNNIIAVNGGQVAWSKTLPNKLASYDYPNALTTAWGNTLVTSNGTSTVYLDPNGTTLWTYDPNAFLFAIGPNQTIVTTVSDPNVAQSGLAKTNLCALGNAVTPTSYIGGAVAAYQIAQANGTLYVVGCDYTDIAAGHTCIQPGNNNGQHPNDALLYLMALQL